MQSMVEGMEEKARAGYTIPSVTPCGRTTSPSRGGIRGRLRHSAAVSLRNSSRT